MSVQRSFSFCFLQRIMYRSVHFSAYAAALIMVIVFGSMGSYGMDHSHTIELYIVMAAMTAMAFYRHRANIGRLLHGTESKVFLNSKNKK